MEIMTITRIHEAKRLSMLSTYLCYKTKNFSDTDSVATKIAEKIANRLNAIRTECKNSSDKSDILVLWDAEANGDMEAMLRMVV